MKKMFVRTGDIVQVLSGKSKGVQGEVIAVSPKEDKVIVKKVNVVTKHVKPTKMGEQGGLVEVESALYASKVQLVCPKCGKPTRVGHGFETKTNAAGKEKNIPVRICKKCGHNF